MAIIQPLTPDLTAAFPKTISRRDGPVWLRPWYRERTTVSKNWLEPDHWLVPASLAIKLSDRVDTTLSRYHGRSYNMAFAPRRRHETIVPTPSSARISRRALMEPLIPSTSTRSLCNRYRADTTFQAREQHAPFRVKHTMNWLLYYMTEYSGMNQN